jgi:hypothetical protein
MLNRSTSLVRASHIMAATALSIPCCRKYALDDPVLTRIARIVDEADTVTDVELEPAAPGLDLLCRGLRRISHDDLTAFGRATVLYNALYAGLEHER